MNNNLLLVISLWIVVAGIGVAIFTSFQGLMIVGMIWFLLVVLFKGSKDLLG